MNLVQLSKRFAFVALAFLLVGTAVAQQRMSDSDVENLATHYAGKKARSVVYITLPAR